jgi:RimJ/RimL family protein N-acetyltransferase
VERDDVKKYHEWVNDPEVTDGLSLLFPMSIEDEERWYESTLSREMQERPFAIEVRTGDGWRLIGNCSFFGIEREARSGEIGIMIGDKSMWHQGLGAEAMLLLLRFGFETLNLNRIFLRVYADNLRAKKAYEKTGFVLEGTMRQAVYKHGRYMDVHLMSVLRSEWEKGK